MIQWFFYDINLMFDVLVAKIDPLHFFGSLANWTRSFNCCYKCLESAWFASDLEALEIFFEDFWELSIRCTFWKLINF